jgi:hypothetical protein
VAEAANSTLFVVVLVAVDFAITLCHTLQEWKGAGAPLWRNFGAIVGTQLPDRVGFAIFTVLLTLILFVIGFVGITGLLGAGLTAFALGALIGARLSDTLISHVLLYAIGYRPNPGLTSTPLYIAEALFLAWFFWPRLAAAPLSAGWGFGIGIAVFVLVLPLLWVVRLIWPGLQRRRWQAWQPIPAWAATNP